MGNQSTDGAVRGVVCNNCGKHVSGDSRPVGECEDCGGWFVSATPSRLACDRCGNEDASRVLNSEYNRLCTDCVDWENRENPECPDCGRRMMEVDPPQTAGPQSWECPDCWRHLDGDDCTVSSNAEQSEGNDGGE